MLLQTHPLAGVLLALLLLLEVMTARLLTSADLNAMLQALTSASVFTTARTPDTCEVRHTKTGELVLKALSKGPRGPWIARIHPNLFD